jgi:hypothetical protein
MINIYQQPTEKVPTLGMTFEFFKTMELGLQYEKYPDLNTARHYMREAKADVLLINTEAFWMYCEKHIEKPLQSDTECIKTIRDSVNKGLEYKEKYAEILVDIEKKANFMRALIKALPEKNRATGIMMAAAVIKFCKEEINEFEENKSKE